MRHTLSMLCGAVLLAIGVGGCGAVLEETPEELGTLAQAMYADGGPGGSPDAGSPGAPDAGAPDAGTPDGGGGGGGGVCTVETVNGVVRQCCTNVGPYGPYTNCTNFSNEFHQLCQQQGITCRSITASCEGEEFGHAFNMVQLSNGQWCFVEPQGTGVIEPCFADPNSPSGEALCTIMGAELEDDGTCPCAVEQNSETPLPINTNPVTACALNPSRIGTPPSIPAFAACEQCCRDEIAYYQNLTPPPPESEINSWFNNCYYACRNHYHPDWVSR